jgi:hypothetical protein
MNYRVCLMLSVIGYRPRGQGKLQLLLVYAGCATPTRVIDQNRARVHEGGGGERGDKYVKRRRVHF